MSFVNVIIIIIDSVSLAKQGDNALGNVRLYVNPDQTGVHVQCTCSVGCIGFAVWAAKHGNYETNGLGMRVLTDGRTDRRANGWMEGRHQEHYLPASLAKATRSINMKYFSLLWQKNKPLLHYCRNLTFFARCRLTF